MVNLIKTEMSKTRPNFTFLCMLGNRDIETKRECVKLLFSTLNRPFRVMRGEFPNDSVLIGDVGMSAPFLVVLFENISSLESYVSDLKWNFNTVIHVFSVMGYGSCIRWRIWTYSAQIYLKRQITVSYLPRYFDGIRKPLDRLPWRHVLASFIFVW